MHRFFLTSEDQVFDNKININNKDLIHQFKDVLKFRINDKIILIYEKKVEYISEITEINPENYNLQILETQKNLKEPDKFIHLFFSLLKKQGKIEWILQKATEIGVSEFTPIITERTEKKSLGKIPRLNNIIKEASEQSGRTVIPKLNEPAKFKSLIPKNINDYNLIPHPAAEKTISNIITGLPAKSKINIYIGPEGGFTENEINYLKTNKNFQLFNLGPRILRTETAAIIAPALILLN